MTVDYNRLRVEDVDRVDRCVEGGLTRSSLFDELAFARFLGFG
jgi:hypothetical protein